ncbi:MAG: hypothetical protein GX070_06685 [Alcaligenaceae bacterium]|nr:hypothetical protein [Alcaligenaceae bacterium]
MSRYIYYENLDGIDEQLPLASMDTTPKNILEIKKLLVDKLALAYPAQDPSHPKTEEEQIDKALNNVNITPSSIKLVID